MFRKIAAYSASLYGVTLLSSAISFAVTMMVARRIPKEALGLYGFYVTVYAFIGMLICSGVNQALVKLAGSRPEDRRGLTRLVLSIATATALLAWPAAAFAWTTGSVSWTWGLAVLPFFLVTLLAASLFRSAFEQKKEVALNLAISLLNSTLTIGFAFLASDAHLAPIRGDFLSITIPGVIVAALLARQSSFRPWEFVRSFRSTEAKSLFRFALPLTIAGAAFVAYLHASKLLIGGFVGLSALGEYYFALQLMLVLDKPLEILSSVVLAAFAQDPDITPEKHRRLVTFNVAVFPLVGAAVVFAAPVLLQVGDIVLSRAGGEPLVTKYPNAPLFLALFALAVPFRCVEFLISTLAIARGRPEANRNTHVITAAIAIPVLTVLVWRFGVWGAAAMPLFYQVTFVALQAKQLRREMPEIVAHCTRAATISTVLLAVLLWAGTTPGAFWYFPLAAAIYLAAGQIAGAWDARTLRGPRVEPAVAA